MSSQKESHNTDTDEKTSDTIHVLVVDDDPVYRDFLSKLLKQLNYRVTTVDGGSKALQLLKQQATNKIPKKDFFDIMLLDAFMPEMDGFELLRIFKQAYTLDVPTIMISSSEDPDTITKCFQCGAEDFLQKPIRLDLLKKRVELCLQDRARRIEEKKKLSVLERQRETIKNLTSQLEQFKSEISGTIETPIQVVMKLLGDLMKDTKEPTSVNQYKGALIAILKSLGQHDLYKPVFEEIEASTRKWLQTEYSTNTLIPTLKPKKPLPKKKETGKEQLKKIEEQFKRTLKDLHEFKCDILKCNEQELLSNIGQMFKELGLFEEFNIDPETFINFFKKAYESYTDTPYHNFMHAADVTQFIFACLKIPKFATFFTPLDKLALMVSAICHDMHHPGLNNTYHINASSKLALKYNDISVLENLHCSSTFKLLKNPDYNIVASLSPDQFNEFRKSVISAILATDMSRHFEITTKFQTRINTGPLTKDLKDRQLLMMILLKCADISNAVRPWPAASEWAERLVQEFLKQGDTEREQGLPVSPLMDRKTLVKPKFQLDFYDYIAGPLFKVVAEYAPELSILVETMASNRAKWFEELNKLKEKKEEQQIEDKSSKVVYGELDESSGLMAKIKGFFVLTIASDKQAREELQKAIQQRGYDCDTVEDGEEALQALPTKDYDLIVLDFSDESAEVAKMIRECKFQRRLPIIAIAKKDMTDAQQKCKKLDIDHLLFKPVHKKELLSTIQTWIAKSLDTAPCIDLKVALEQSGDDTEFLKQIIALFVEESSTHISKLEKAIEAKDWKEIELVAHSMKGASAQIAAKPLSQAAFDLEQAAKLKQENALKPALNVIKQRFNIFENEALTIIDQEQQ